MLTLFNKKLGTILILLFGAALLWGRIQGGSDRGMLTYMKQKYGEDFEKAEMWNGQFGKNYTMLKVRSRSKPEETALVRELYTENGKIFQDNYLAVLCRDEIEQEIKELARPIFGVCKVFYKIPELVFPEDYAADMDAEAFLKNPASMVRIYLYPAYDSKQKEEQVETFLHKVTEKGYVIGGAVCYLTDREVYDRLDRDNFMGDRYRGCEAAAEAVFSLDEKGNLQYLEWIYAKNRSRKLKSKGGK